MPRPPQRSLAGRFSSAVKAVASMATFTLSAMVFRGGTGGSGGWGRRWLAPGSHYDYQAEAGDLWRNSAVAACLRVLRVNFSEPFLEVAAGPEPDADPVPAHPMAELLRRPNKRYTSSALWSATVLSLVVDGNAYWVKIRSQGGRVVELWWVPHWMIRPVAPADGSQFISHYEYTPNGKTYRLPPSEVIHFRQGLDPHDETRGMSDLQAAIREVCSDNEAAGYSAALLRNSGVPTVVITPNEDGGRFGEGQPDDIRGEWRRRFTAEGRGDPLVTDSLKVTKLGFSPKELDLGDLPSRFEDRICALIGVNSMVAGLTSGGAHKTYANYGEGRRALYEDTIIPMQKAAAEELTLQLLAADFEPDTTRRVVRWVYKGVQCLQENLNDLVERVGKQYQTYQVITRGEARKALGFDERPEDDVFFADVAGSTPPAPAAAAGTKPPAAAGDDPADVEDPDDDEDDDESTKALTRRVLRKADRLLGDAA